VSQASTNPNPAGGEVHPRYLCPRTRAPLRMSGDDLRSDTSDIAYPVRSGIPQFLHFAPAESAEDSANLQKLIKLARDTDWLSALREIHKNDAAFVRYVTEEKRSSFVRLLPLTRESNVLEIGTGLGQFTTVLARHAKSVCGLEVVGGQAEFVVERCRQLGLNNVHLAVGGDDCRLPYGDASFDLIVLNLVFEWCASRCEDESHLDVQHRLLAEMHRVLKPGGTLYLVTKNRFALAYVIGKPDEHYGQMRFGSALPRWLANTLLRLRGQARSAGQLYSHDTLKAMLHKAGFGKSASYWAAPEMRFPTHYVPTDAASIRKARLDPELVQGDMRSTNLLMRWIPAALVKHFTPGLAFIVHKQP
jgi:SAM-dependent methyltransferase